MSDKPKFGDKFSNRFHIGKVARKPLRKEVTELRSRALKLPQTHSGVKGVVIQLEDARKTIFGKVSTNKEREASVQTTQDIVDKVKPKLEELERSGLEPVTYEVKGKAASKEDLKRAKELLGKLDPLKTSVDKLFDPKSGVAVLMPKDLGRLDLLGAIEGVKRHIAEGIVDTERAKQLDLEIDAVSTTIDDAAKFIATSRSKITRYDELIKNGMDALASVADALDQRAQRKNAGKVPGKNETPLGEALARLTNMAHPEMGMINPEALVAAAKDVRKQMRAATADPAAYARKASRRAEGQGKVEALLAQFDTDLEEPLRELFERASAVGTADHARLAGKSGLARAELAKKAAKEDVDVEKITDPILKEIDDAKLRLDAEAKALRKRVADTRKALDDVLTAIAATKGQKFFKADWVAIDALLGTVDGLIPAATAPLDAQTLDQLGSADPLLAKLKKQAEGLMPAKSQPAVDKYDLAKAAVDKVMRKNGDAPADLLKKYDPKTWTELEEAYKKIEDSVGVSRYADVVKSIEDFKANKFDPAVKTGLELAPAVAAAIVARDKFNALYVSAQLVAAETDLPAPNTQEMALAAVEAELKKTPPSKAKLEQLKTAIEAAWTNIGTVDELVAAIAVSHTTETDKAVKEKADGDANRVPLKDRLYALEMQFAEARSMVDAVDGDKNAVKSIERLLEQAKSEIKGVTADATTTTKPTGTMNRIQGRIDLMIAHPEGEANRKLKELPELYNEFRAIRAEAAGHLKAVRRRITTYIKTTDQGDQRLVKRLRGRVSRYDKQFTVEGDDFAPSIDALVDTSRPPAERAKAREHVLAGIATLQRGIKAHPISVLLAKSPTAGAKGVPRRLLSVLDRLRLTVVTSVEA